MNRNRNRKQRRKGVRQRRQVSDQIVLKGTWSIAAETDSSGEGMFAGVTGTYTIDPTVIGNRVSAVAGIFTRWRIRRLRVKYVPQVGSTTAGAMAMGFLDDVGTSAEGTGVANYSETINLRQSNSSAIWQVSTINYRPQDPDKWYYTTGDGSDPRFEIPCCIVSYGSGLSNSTTYGNFVIQYILEFKGAVAPFTPT